MTKKEKAFDRKEWLKNLVEGFKNGEFLLEGNFNETWIMPLYALHQLDIFLEILQEDQEIISKIARVYKKFFDSLTKAGFSQEQAMELLKQTISKGGATNGR